MTIILGRPTGRVESCDPSGASDLPAWANDHLPVAKKSEKNGKDMEDNQDIFIKIYGKYGKSLLISITRHNGKSDVRTQ